MNDEKPKILIFDIEIIPNMKEILSMIPRLYKGSTMGANLSSICTIGYKVHGQKRAYTINIWDFKNWEKDINNDRRVLEEFLKIIKDADCLVSHYGDRFDKPYVETRLLYNDLGPMPPIKNIDTWKIVKYKLKMSHRDLNSIAKALDVTPKLETGGWKLWVDVCGKKKKACKLMSKYCKQDVQTLDEVFTKLKPYTNIVPNHNLFIDHEKDDILCPTCGSDHIQKRGWYVTPVNKYRRMQCMKCGTWIRVDLKGRKPRVVV